MDKAEIFEELNRRYVEGEFSAEQSRAYEELQSRGVIPRELGTMEGVGRSLERGLYRGVRSIGGILESSENMKEAPDMVVHGRKVVGGTPNSGLSRLPGKLVRGIEGAYDWATGSEGTDFGKYIIESMDKKLESPDLQQSASLQNKTLFEKAIDPTFYIENLPEQAGNLAANFASAYLTRGRSLAVQAAAFSAPTAVLEGGNAYGDTFKAMKKQGATDEQAEASASRAALITGVGASMLERIPAAAYLMKRVPGSEKFLSNSISNHLAKAVAARGAAGMTSEAITEIAQEAWADFVEYSETEDPKTFDNAFDRYGSAGILGGVMGGSISASSQAAQEISKQRQIPFENIREWAEANPEKASELAAKENPSRADFLKAGLRKRSGKDRAAVSAELREMQTESQVEVDDQVGLESEAEVAPVETVQEPVQQEELPAEVEVQPEPEVKPEDLSSLTWDEVKARAKEAGIPVKGKRSDLESKIMESQAKSDFQAEGFDNDTELAPGDGAMSAIYQGESGQQLPSRMNVGEMNRMLKQAGESVPKIIPKMRALGQFRHKGDQREIALRSDIFVGPVIVTGTVNPVDVEATQEALTQAVLEKFPELSESDIEVRIEKEGDKQRITLYKVDPNFAAKITAHEIGHWVDYMPDADMKRGNILGRLATLSRHMSNTLDKESGKEGLDPKAASAMRARARKAVGKAPKKGTEEYKQWKQNVDQKFAEMADAEGFIARNEIDQELKELTMWWNPFDEGASDKYTKYRYSSKELYAEALSVLLNDPAALKQRAPIFYYTWFQFLDRKPEVKAAYDQVVDEVVSGVSGNKMLSDLREGFRRGDEAKMREAESRKKGRRIGTDIGTAFLDRAWSLNRIVAKARKAGKEFADPTQIIDKAKYSGSQIVQYHHDSQDIANYLEQNGVTEDDFDTYLMHMRHLHAEGEGGKRAIPVYGDLAALQKAHEAFVEAMGPNKMIAIERARKRFREVREKHVLNRIEDTSPYDAEFIEFLKRNEYYSRNEVVKFIDRKHGEGTGRQIYGNALKIEKRLGTLEEINRPWIATMAADEQMIYSLNWNHAKNMVGKFLQENGEAGQYFKAETKWNGKFQAPIEPSDPEMGLVTYMEDGQVKGYYTDKRIAQSFEPESDTIRTVAGMLRVFSHPSRMWFTVLRPGFQIFNTFFRDPIRTVINTGVNPVQLYKNLYSSLGDVARDLKYHDDKEIKEMRERGLLVTFGNMAEQDDDTRQLERQLGKYRDEHLWDKNIANPFRRYYSTLLTIGSIGEAANKKAAYVTLKENQKELGLTDAEIDHRVRHWAGSPSFVTGGSITPITNNVLLFSNAAIQGWRSDIEAFQHDKVGVVKRRLAYAVMPKLVALAFAGGAVGYALRELGMDEDDPMVEWADGLQRIYAGASEYDLTNYNVIPVGLTESGKSVYIRVPVDETSRVISGSFFKLFSNEPLKAIQDISGYVKEQGPGFNPAFSLGDDVLTYMTGGNPYDGFRERHAVPERIREAGGLESHKAFSRWLWNAYGGSMVYKFPYDNPAEIKSNLEEWLQMPFAGDTFGRFVRVSDFGITQKLERKMAEARKEKTRQNLSVDRAVKRELKGDARSSDREKLDTDRAKTTRERLTAQGGQIVDKAMQRAQSAAEKSALLKELWRIQGETPALTKATASFVGSQLYRATSQSASDSDIEEAMSLIEDLPVDDLKKAFDAYWRGRGYSTKTDSYRRRVGALKSLK